MARHKYSYERKAYTFFLLLGDAGGFNGSVMSVCSAFLSYYTAAMYKKAVASETPIRRVQKNKKPSQKEKGGAILNKIFKDDATAADEPGT